jgi:Zinc binding domain
VFISVIRVLFTQEIIMSDCCSTTDESCAVPEVKTVSSLAGSVQGACPSCGQKGKTVDTQTVKALLAVSLEAVNETTTYRFCRTPDCRVVYFDEEASIFTEADLRERVHQKNPQVGDVFVCYCYRHTPDSIRAELAAQGETDVVARVTAGTKAGTCACDIRNPKGSCCLGNVGKVVKQIMAEAELVSA